MRGLVNTPFEVAAGAINYVAGQSALTNAANSAFLSPSRQPAQEAVPEEDGVSSQQRFGRPVRL